MRTFLEQQKYLIDYTLAALLRRKTRNLGLWLIYSLLVFLFSSVLLFSQATLLFALGLIAEQIAALRFQNLVRDEHRGT